MKGTSGPAANIRPGNALLLGGIALFVLGSIFLIPMRIYRIGFVRTVVFLLLSGALSGAGQFAFGRVLHNPGARFQADLSTAIQNLAPANRSTLRGIIGQRAPESAFALSEKTALDRTKTFEERRAALGVIYADLEKTRLALRPGDAPALAGYEKQKARYEELLRTVRTEYAAQAAGATPVPRQ